MAAKSPLLAMANRADLATRVGAVLDSRQRRGRAGTLPVALACAAAAALVLTISPLTVVAAQQSGAKDARVAPAVQLSSSTGLVIEAVTVSDQNGKIIEGLSANDFAITEDGVPQYISIFEFQKLDSAHDSVSSYYILGYYPGNQNVDGVFRNIKITGKDERMAKLKYRPGYYAGKSWTRFGASAAGIQNGAAAAGSQNVAVDRSVDPGITAPRLISKVEPEYSLEARKAKFQGSVVLSVEVNASGQVTGAKVSKSLGLGLDEKAIEAVKQWRFEPGMKDGKPVATQAQVQLDFRLL